MKETCLCLLASMYRNHCYMSLCLCVTMEGRRRGGKASVPLLGRKVIYSRSYIYMVSAYLCLSPYKCAAPAHFAILCHITYIYIYGASAYILLVPCTLCSRKDSVYIRHTIYCSLEVWRMYTCCASPLLAYCIWALMLHIYIYIPYTSSRHLFSCVLCLCLLLLPPAYGGRGGLPAACFPSLLFSYEDLLYMPARRAICLARGAGSTRHRGGCAANTVAYRLRMAYGAATRTNIRGDVA